MIAPLRLPRPVIGIAAIPALFFPGAPRADTRSGEDPAPHPGYDRIVLALPKPYSGEAIADLGFMPGGQICVLTSSGQLLTARLDLDAADEMRWQILSDHRIAGVSGMDAGNPGAVLVTHSTGISALFDTDDDGKADFFKTMLAGWKMGPGQAFFHGNPLTGGDGRLWFALAGVGNHPLRGCVLHTPVEKPGRLSVWAAGFHQIPGLCRGPGGELLASGQALAGDGAVPLYRIYKGAYGGEPQGLWHDARISREEGFTPEDWIAANPGEYVKRLLKPAVWIPGDLRAAKPTRPVYSGTGADTPESWADQIFVGGIASGRIVRIMIDGGNAGWQGAAVDFLDPKLLEGGVAALEIDRKNGALIVGQKGRLLVFRPSEEPAFAIVRVVQAQDGFVVSFNRPVDRSIASDPARYPMRSFSYHLAPDRSGDGPTDVTEHVPADALVDSDGLSVSLRLPPADPGKVVAFDFSGIPSETGAFLKNARIYYTVTRRPEPQRSSLSQFLSLPNVPAPPVESGVKAAESKEPAPPADIDPPPPPPAPQNGGSPSAKPEPAKPAEVPTPPPAGKETASPGSAGNGP